MGVTLLKGEKSLWPPQTPELCLSCASLQSSFFFFFRLEEKLTLFPLHLITSGLEHKLRPTDGRQVEELVNDVYFLTGPDVFGLGAFLEMVGILEGLAPPGLRGVSEVSEQTERASCSSEASEASLPRRLLALLPARLPARLAGPLRVDPPRFGSSKTTKTLKMLQSQKQIILLKAQFVTSSNI